MTEAAEAGAGDQVVAAGHRGAAAAKITTVVHTGRPDVMVRVPAAVFVVNLVLAANTILVAFTLYALTGSASNFALVLVSDFALAAVVQLVAGYVVDRVGSSRLAVVSQTVACAALVLQALASLLPMALAWIIGGAVLVNVMRAFYRASMFALTPLLVKQGQLAALNARINGTFQAGMLLGAALGALLVLLKPAAWGFVILAVACALATLLLSTLPRADRNPAFGRSDVVGVRTTFRELRAQRGLATHIFLCSGDFISVSMFVLLVVPLVHTRFDGSATVLMLINGALPVGVIGSSLLPWRLQQRDHTLRLLLASMSCLLAMFLLLAVGSGLIFTVACVAVLGFAAGSSQTLLMTSLQLRSPKHLLGRIGSLRLFVASAISAPTLAFASYTLADGVGTALWYCAVVEAIYLILVIVLSRRSVLGGALLSPSCHSAATPHRG